MSWQVNISLTYWLVGERTNQLLRCKIALSVKDGNLLTQAPISSHGCGWVWLAVHNWTTLYKLRTRSPASILFYISLSGQVQKIHEQWNGMCGGCLISWLRQGQSWSTEVCQPMDLCEVCPNLTWPRIWSVTHKRSLLAHGLVCCVP